MRPDHEPDSHRDEQHERRITHDPFVETEHQTVNSGPEVVRERIMLVARLQNRAKANPIEPDEEQETNGEWRDEMREGSRRLAQREALGAQYGSYVHPKGRYQDRVCRFRHNGNSQGDAAR